MTKSSQWRRVRLDDAFSFKKVAINVAHSPAAALGFTASNYTAEMTNAGRARSICSVAPALRSVKLPTYRRLFRAHRPALNSAPDRMRQSAGDGLLFLHKRGHHPQRQSRQRQSDVPASTAREQHAATLVCHPFDAAPEERCDRRSTAGCHISMIGNHDLDAGVHLPAGRRFVARDRIGRAVSAHEDAP